MFTRCKLWILIRCLTDNIKLLTFSHVTMVSIRWSDLAPGTDVWVSCDQLLLWPMLNQSRSGCETRLVMMRTSVVLMLFCLTTLVKTRGPPPSDDYDDDRENSLRRGLDVGEFPFKRGDRPIFNFDQGDEVCIASILSYFSKIYIFRVSLELFQNSSKVWIRSRMWWTNKERSPKHLEKLSINVSLVDNWDKYIQNYIFYILYESWN